MKNKILYPLLILIALIMGIGWIRCYNSNKQFKEVIKIQYKDTTSYSWDQYQSEHATNQILKGDMEIEKAAHAKDIAGREKRLKIQSKQITEFQTIVAHTKGKTPLHDTFYLNADNDTVKEFANDGDFSAEVENDNTIAYSFNITLNRTNYWKRSWLLAPKKYFADVYSPNKDVHIVGFTNGSVLAKEPSRIGISAFGGMVYDGNSIRPAIGAGITYTIFRFK